MDDVQSGGDSISELETFKEQATTIMEKGGFTLHKWHSNVEELESISNETAKGDQDSNTKAYSESTTKILGVPWEKKTDVVRVSLEACQLTVSPLTKRKILAAINGVYDLLGWASPVMITGKIVFSELCLRKVSWDEQVPDDIVRRWNQWAKTLRECTEIKVPRSVVNNKSQQISIHGFADASQLAVCAAVYVLATYNDGKTSHNLLVSKFRVAPKKVSIPRLELVAAHTLAKLLSHVNRALKNKQRRSWKKVDSLYISGTATLRSWNPFQTRLRKVIKIPTRKLTVSQRQRSSEFLGKRKRTLFELASKLVNSQFHH